MQPLFKSFLGCFYIKLSTILQVFVLQLGTCYNNLKVGIALKNNKISAYIDSISKVVNEDKKANKNHKDISMFFNNTITFLSEENLVILLVTDILEVLASYPSQSFDYSSIENKRITLDLKSTESFKTERFSGVDISIYSSSIQISQLSDGDYRLLCFGLDFSGDRLKEISNKLLKSLDTLMAYGQEKNKEYNTLVSFLDSVDDGISACDDDGIVTYINKSACAMLHTTKEEVLKRDLKTFIPDSILLKTIKTKQTYLDVEYFIDYKDKIMHLMSSAYPVFDRDKQIIGAIDIYRRIKRSIKVATHLVGYHANYTFDDFIGDSKSLADTIVLAKKFAHSDKNILITGDSGTGKELFAQSIHNYSHRKNGPFVAINCASYPRDLFESELFGYDEGAFTGAKKGGKTGKFELASGGTIFLDEIGEMPLHLQAKLLRVIESKTITRIGSNKKSNIDVRIIAATNRNLEEMISNNSFREDLFYRLKILYLHLESLKNRGNDCAVLCDHFIKKFSDDSSKVILGLDSEAREYVKKYHWPGNIRELENIISLSLFYAEGQYITKDNLIKSGLNVIETIPRVKEKKEKLSTITNEIILETLEKNKGNKKKTAEELGISRNTIYRLLK